MATRFGCSGQGKTKGDSFMDRWWCDAEAKEAVNEWATSDKQLSIYHHFEWIGVNHILLGKNVGRLAKMLQNDNEPSSSAFPNELLFDLCISMGKCFLTKRKPNGENSRKGAVTWFSDMRIYRLLDISSRTRAMTSKKKQPNRLQSVVRWLLVNADASNLFIERTKPTEPSCFDSIII